MIFKKSISSKIVAIATKELRMTRHILALAGVGVLTMVASASQAVQIAQFRQLNVNAADFRLVGGSTNVGKLGTNNLPSTTTVGGPQLTVFTFGSPYGVLNNQSINSTLVLTATADQPANNASGSPAQRFKNVSFSFLAAANGLGIAVGTNLLTGTASTNGLLGNSQLTTAVTSGTFSGGDRMNGGVFDDNLVFSSALANFAASASDTNQDSFSFSFSNVRPNAAFIPSGPNSRISSFTASGTGTFSTSDVPEPGAVAMLISSSIGLGLLRRRRSRKA